MAEQEIHFFDKDYNYEKGPDWYARFFERVTTQSIVAEKTPEYLWANGRGGKGVHSHNPDVHRRIKSHFPDARFIVVLRDPVRRALSAANHVLSYGYISPSYSLESVLFGSKRHIGNAFGLLGKGLYAECLEAFFELFDRSRFLILGFEDDLCSKPKETMTKVCDFLSLAPFKFAQLDQRENQVQASLAGMWVRYLFPRFKKCAHFLDQRLSAHRASASQSLKARLCEFYRPQNERLFTLLQTRYGGWS